MEKNSSVLLLTLILKSNFQNKNENNSRLSYVLEVSISES